MRLPVAEPCRLKDFAAELLDSGTERGFRHSRFHASARAAHADPLAEMPWARSALVTLGAQASVGFVFPFPGRLYDGPAEPRDEGFEIFPGRRRALPGTDIADASSLVKADGPYPGFVARRASDGVGLPTPPPFRVEHFATQPLYPLLELPPGRNGCGGEALKTHPVTAWKHVWNGVADVACGALGFVPDCCPSPLWLDDFATKLGYQLSERVPGCLRFPRERLCAYQEGLLSRAVDCMGRA
jgi:hypothetical protein